VGIAIVVGLRDQRPVGVPAGSAMGLTVVVGPEDQRRLERCGIVVVVGPEDQRRLRIVLLLLKTNDG